ncbi:R-spondin-1 isoform X2 [Neomonachus schauinslandi]|uniref:R-spondin-1 isoform X2 n=1 Tax=Neomonachus schauinslandi TaxID=29088 RepID=A0A8M1MBJ4_NEOSC|nr:R-spondin-1 isoform X2 [Neomonachus schauinslandi]
MRLGLCVVALVLSWMHLAAGSRGIKGKRQRRISVEGSQACAKGCELCSEVNGCLKCSPKLFILLERNDIRQVGVCLPSCPPGYFDARNPDMNKCIKCKIEHCEACFSHNFCTKCKENLYLHKGRCYPACPEGSAAANGTMECSSPGQKRRKGGRGENANRNLSRKESKEVGAGARRRKGQQQPQHQGTVGPVTPAGST